MFPNSGGPIERLILDYYSYSTFENTGHFSHALSYTNCTNGGFSRYGTHFFAHDLSRPLGFHVVMRGIGKIQKNALNFWFPS